MLLTVWQNDRVLTSSIKNSRSNVELLLQFFILNSQFLILNFPISPSTSTRSSIFFARSIRNLASIMRLRIRLSKLSLATLGSSLRSELEAIVGLTIRVQIVQSAIFSPGTCSKSRRLRVTTVASTESAIAAILKSCLRRFLRSE